MADYRIKLTPYTPEVVEFEGKDTFRVKIVASNATDMPVEIFGHQRTPIDPATSTYQDEFVFVCTAYDLSTYPANTPDMSQDPPFFRKDTMDILVPNIVAGNKVIEEVKAQVHILVADLFKLDALNLGTVEWVPSIGCTAGFTCLDNGDIHTWAADTDFELLASPTEFAIIIIDGESFRVDNVGGNVVWDIDGATDHVFTTIGDVKSIVVNATSYEIKLIDDTSLQFSVNDV